MTPPLDTPTAFEIKRVEHKKDGTTKDGKAFTILNLGLLAPNGEKIWPAEFFAIGEPSSWPAEGATSTFVLSQPDNPEWALKASRPRKGGGFQGNAAKDDYWNRKEQRDIEGTRRMGRAHSQEMALRLVALHGQAGDYEATAKLVKHWTDWFQKDVDSA